MKVKIFNDSGIAHKTKITNVETGEKIPGVYKVEFIAEMNRTTKARLYTHPVDIDVVTDAEIIKERKVDCEDCKHNFYQFTKTDVCIIEGKGHGGRDIEYPKEMNKNHDCRYYKGKVEKTEFGDEFKSFKFAK